MLSVKEMRGLAQRLSAEKFRHQMGPFALVQRPAEEDLDTTQKMGLPFNAAHTAMAKPEDISRGILSLLFEFENLEVATLPPMSEADPVLSVGRLPDCELVIDHKSVSKRHAELRWDEKTKRCTVRDVGSTNGTFLNSSLLVRREASLRDGDIISFGEVQFWYLATDTLHQKLAKKAGFF
ncbi:MAG: FHA domain-containing protein [Myxococcota bacterium]|nr:FHA domain-containing protein [Myxococcota bacterium]